ncbi:MAG: hypothetical protein RLO80_01750 [Hyphomonas sp.]
MMFAAVLIAACSGEQPAAEAPAAELAAPAEPEAAELAATRPDNDPITALCRDMMKSRSAEECECATRAFRASSEDAGTYGEMARFYLNDTDPETPLADRWDEVVNVVLADVPGSKLEKSNALGKAHREALKSCES